MAFRFDRDESLADGIRRIAREEIDAASAWLSALEEDRDKAVHDARKGFKRMRALVRLARATLGPEVFAAENAFYRDVGRQLSAARDSAALIEAAESLHERFGNIIAEDVYRQVRAALGRAYEEAQRSSLDDADAAPAVVAALAEGHARVETWPIDGDGFGLVRDGLRQTYAQGQDALAAARHDPVPECFHEWRKHVKYLWHHVELFSPLWPETLDAFAGELHELADALGDDHDLLMLHHRLVAEPAHIGALGGAIGRRRSELQSRARSLGARIYAESPDAFTERIERYWRVWQDPDA
ncbi:MAG: hypothetical protein QG656_597 [Candidatus Hydrogenedentes bacterium]|nr:hypothetical protein [Candidatus Hydrogenedentota bacterium]